MVAAAVLAVVPRRNHKQMAMPRYPKSMSEDSWRRPSADSELDSEVGRTYTAQMSFPDRAALRDLGSFGSSCRERMSQEEVMGCGDDCGGRDGQSGHPLEVPSGTLIKLRLICASGIHQGSYFSFMAPCAVMSTASSEDAFVTRPAAKGSDTFPVWNAVATFEVQGQELIPVETPVKNRKTAPKLVLRKAATRAATRTGSGTVGGSEESTGAGSPSQQQTLIQHKSQQKSQQWGRKLGRSRSARLCPYPSSFPDVKVDIYTSEKLKSHLGSVRIPVKQALETPGTPVLGSFELTRKGFMGAHKKEGHLRAIIVALPPGQTDFME